ncbi:hypothetical protein [Actinomyces oris]|uniref:hypothetical protein n=1 Tax=Actinomyces oris TaxID=544580 RepID=UPI000309D45F|nr:hypothetical protein [Actinomyces oris]
MAAAASTWTNIATKLSSCASDLDKVCSSRLAGQESLAVATFKTLQAGSASHLRMTGQLAGAISGGLTVTSRSCAWCTTWSATPSPTSSAS